jgi:hypothetical protein
MVMRMKCGLPSLARKSFRDNLVPFLGAVEAFESSEEGRKKAGRSQGQHTFRRRPYCLRDPDDPAPDRVE